jgi:hypothetical protein
MDGWIYRADQHVDAHEGDVGVVEDELVWSEVAE